MKHLFMSMIIGVSIISFSIASIIHVPGNQPTIQEGINAAVNGDTVLVSDGLYYENINFKGKAITVASTFLMDQDTSHISNTIINGAFHAHPDSGSVIYFISGEDTNSVLCGFTITGGTGTISPQYNARVGGGIYFYSSGGRIQNNYIQNNTLNYNGFAYGGGIECDDGADPIHFAIIENNLISNNSISAGLAPWGGGIDLFSNGEILGNHVFDNLLFSENNGYCHGGGIVCCCSDTLNRRFALVEGNTIENNQAFSSGATWGGFGGGLYINRSDAHIINNTIQNNEVSGGINCAGAGMAMWASGNTSIIKGNLIRGNKVASGNCFGGGLQLHTVPSVVVEKNLLIRNEGSNGGGIVCTNADPFIQNNLIIENKAVNGGGIHVYIETEDEANEIFKSMEGRSDNYNNSLYKSQRGEFNQNRAELPQTCEPHIINNTIFGNTASNFGGGIYIRNSSPIIMNTILWGDSAQSGGHEILISSGGTIEVHYSDVQGSWPGTENINADPLFEDTLLFHLLGPSPCIGAGIDSLQIGGVWYYCPSCDCEGGLRPNPDTSMPDIGAWESPLASPVVGLETRFSNNLPKSFDLKQNYPNPFNPSTTIEFDLPKSSKVTLIIYNILGEEVTTIVSERLSFGTYAYNWDASNLASGIYLYRLQAGDYVETRKMVLMK